MSDIVHSLGITERFISWTRCGLRTGGLESMALTKGIPSCLWCAVGKPMWPFEAWTGAQKNEAIK